MRGQVRLAALVINSLAENRERLDLEARQDGIGDIMY